MRQIGSKNPIERQRARERLVAAGHDAVLPLLRRLKEQSGPACWEAAKALAQIKDPASANALVEALEHDDQRVRWVAAQALVALGPEGLKQALVALLTRSHSIVLRDSARAVVSYFAHRMPWEFLMPLLARFDDYEPAVTIPTAALRALHSLDHREAIHAGLDNTLDADLSHDLFDW